MTWIFGILRLGFRSHATQGGQIGWGRLDWIFFGLDY